MTWRETQPNEYIRYDVARSYLHNACQYIGSNGGLELKCRFDHEKTTTVPQWISCSERLPEEDFCSGRGVQYSETVLVTVVNNGDDDDTFVDVACTADGVWQLNYPQDTSPLVPKWCKVIAWMPLPEPYKEEQDDKN